MAWKRSRYTRLVGLADGAGVVYNTRSGAVVRLGKNAFARCDVLLDRCDDGDPLFPHLVAGELVVESDRDALAELEAVFDEARRHSQFLLTIFPTFACNLSCDYCFVATKSGRLTRTQQEQLLEFAAAQFERNGSESLMVDWLGGEPLFALDTITFLSAGFRALCEHHQASYTAQAITNGTMLTSSAVVTLLDAGVERLQITLDGTRAIHDARRPWKGNGRSSFDEILDGIDRAIGRFLIRLRINVDRNNEAGVWKLLDLLDRRGWLQPDAQFFPYLARVSPFTSACAAVSPTTCSVGEFHELNVAWLRRLHEKGLPVALQPLYEFPMPRLYSCGAIGANGFVITADGKIHKCGLEIDARSAAVGKLGAPLDVADWNARTWQAWSPFARAACRDCAFLPSCLGGCARNDLQRREVQLAETCAYYQQFEAKFVAAHLSI